MDPRKAECLGHYLYGAGFHARDDNTLGMVTGRKTPPHFCLTCPRRAECENEHEARVRAAQPAACETFDQRMRIAIRRGIPPTLAAAYIGRKGADPFAVAAIENFNRGHADRGRVAGPLVK